MPNSQQIQPVPVLDLGFLGAGRMATALAVGWKHAGLLKLGHCQASDPFAAACESFHQATGYWATDDNRAMLKASKVVVLAVKPQQLHAVIADLKGDLGAEKLIISIVAGATLPTLCAALGHQRVIRVMPNTPCQVGASASAFSCGKQASTEDSQVVSRLFGSVGKVFELKESLLDAVTGLSGSGPAFVCLMIEALADGGVRAGLPRDVAQTLAAQTVLGTAKMVLETGKHPAQLKDEVASPGGTTIAGLHALEKAGVRGGLIDAVLAAARRAEELGKN
jgi:pyrroline-5-carboxylate reductase